MKNQENIDKYFAERLKGYERKPHEEAWQRLEARLERSQTKVIPLWWNYARAASVLLLLGLGTYGGYHYFSGSATTDVLAETTAQAKNTTKRVPSPVGKEATPPKQVQTQAEDAAAPTTLASAGEFQRKGSTKKASATVKAMPVTRVVPEMVIAKNESKAPEKQRANTENTIILVLEPSKEVKASPETIVLSMVDTQPSSDSPVAQMLEEENTKKESRFSRIWKQLKKAKNGENLDWNEIGIKPQKVLARADAKLENTKDNLIESINTKNSEK